MSNYYQWDGFKDIYLEDSFVLNFSESGRQVSFTMEIVLTEKHPMYFPPQKDEQYCYKRGKIVFQGLKTVKWLTKNIRPFTDADNNEDYGNIDSFRLTSEGYHLSGDWGEVIINSLSLGIVWLT